MCEARALAPVADPFQQALVDGYTKNADDEYDQANYRTADLYYLKAIATADGKNTVMEQPNSWTVATGDRAQGLHGADQQSAENMRGNLAPWIAANKQSNPHAAAVQQLKYDCWIEQMSEQQYNQAALCGPTMQTAAVTAPAPVAELTRDRASPGEAGYPRARPSTRRHARALPGRPSSSHPGQRNTCKQVDFGPSGGDHFTN